MEGADGVLAALSQGQVVMDTGTSRIETDRYYLRACEERGASFLDAPLTWGGPGDRPTMFLGGDQDAYERVKPILEEICSQHHRFGDLGAGQLVKAGHRLRQNNRVMVDVEMVEFLRNNGVEPREVDELLELGLDDRLFEQEYDTTAGWTRAASASEGDDEFEDPEGTELAGGPSRPRMEVSEWAKDQAYAVEIGHASNTALPITAAVYHAMLMSENYAAAMFNRDLSFQDPAWYDRADPVAH